MEKLIVERIEEGIAVLEKEDATYVKIPVIDLCSDLSEGDILTYDGEKYIRNDAEKQERRSKILDLQRKLSQKSKKE